MDITPKQILDLAAKYIGYKEKASNKDLYSFNDNAGKGNYTMFQHELDAARFWNNSKQGYEWCTSFVAWVFWRMLGNAEAKRTLCLTGDYGAGCISWVRYYKQAGRFFDSPKVGDQFFKKGSIGHPIETINNAAFGGCTQTGLTITVYTTGAYADTAVANIRNGATNATIIIKDSTTGETLVTSTP